jgi:hypothetical protein
LKKYGGPDDYRPWHIVTIIMQSKIFLINYNHNYEQHYWKMSILLALAEVVENHYAHANTTVCFLSTLLFHKKEPDVLHNFSTWPRGGRGGRWAGHCKTRTRIPKQHF